MMKPFQMALKNWVLASGYQTKASSLRNTCMTAKNLLHVQRKNIQLCQKDTHHYITRKWRRLFYPAKKLAKLQYNIIQFFFCQGSMTPNIKTIIINIFSYWII